MVYEALAGDDPTWLLRHRLWNTTAQVVRYNDGHPRLDVSCAAGGLRRDGDRWSFVLTDDTGHALALAAARSGTGTVTASTPCSTADSAMARPLP